MHRLRRWTLVQAEMCADLVICAVSLLLATDILQQGFWDHGTLLLRDPLRQILAIIVLSVCWHISLVFTGTYHSYRVAHFKSQALALASGVTATTFCVAVWLLASEGSTRVTVAGMALELALFWIITTCGFVVTRLVGRLCMLAFRRRGRNLRSVLIVGSNQRAIDIADKFSVAIDLGYRLVGFIDNYWHFDDAPDEYKNLLLGDIDGLPGVLRSMAIDEVVVALPIASNYRVIEQIASWCSQQGVRVAFEASLFENVRAPFLGDERMDGMMTLYDAAPSQWATAVKRIIDLLISGGALLIISPILAVIAIAIKLTSPGPVFYVQERLGLGKRRFRILKFRTMVVDAESVLKNLEHLNQSGGPTFKLDRDPRITQFGTFLRRTSLDELPQLMNVFLGDMSMVGPRPLPLRDYQGFSQDWHRRRFSVRPGITCIWQVSGRSSITFEKWMELDMDYIDRWSLWLDLLILFKTIPAVVRGTGAM